MLSSVTIEGFRCFEYFEMKDLGRVNLLVGRNNSGKTSVLEAVYILMSEGDADSLARLLWHRGEQIPSSVPPGSDWATQMQRVELGVSHLFHGHRINVGSRFRVSGSNGSFPRSREYAATRMTERGASGEMTLSVKGQPASLAEQIPLDRDGVLTVGPGSVPGRLWSQRTGETNKVLLLTADSLSPDDLVTAWDGIALTPSESMAVEALRFIDPEVERIAPQAAYRFSGSSKGGFIIKRRGSSHPEPIGSMGDGMWRMLAMAIALTQCRGGVLLVDEVDTGLHYSVMSKMWRLIYQTAVQLDVQVFATTHSYDCVYSLAQLCAETSAHGEVTVQRIEAGKRNAIPYGEDEIAVAAERDIEVR